MASSTFHSKDLYTQMGLAHTFTLFTSEQWGRLGQFNYSQPDESKLSYTPSQLAVAWELLKAIRRSIEQVAAVDEASIPQRFPVFSPESLTKMRQVAGNENAAVDDADAGPGFGQFTNGECTFIEFIWNGFLQTMKMYCEAMKGAKTVELFEDEQLSDFDEWDFPRESTSCFHNASYLFLLDNKLAKEGVSAKYRNHEHLPVKFFHSLVLEAEKHGNVNEFWDLTNLDLVRFLPLLPFTRLVWSLIATPNAVDLIQKFVLDGPADEDEDGMEPPVAGEIYYKQVQDISALETCQAGELSTYVQFLEDVTGRPVDLAK